jgi:hypothetical protein
MQSKSVNFHFQFLIIVENIEIEDEEIDFNKFNDFHEKIPIIIYPAFRLQEKMKEQILGKNRVIYLIQKDNAFGII